MKAIYLSSFALITMALLPFPLHADNSGKDLELFSATSWRFNAGKEFKPGGGGSFTLEKEEGMDIGVLKFDFTSGGAYVGGRTNVNLEKGNYSELRFQAKSDTAQKLSIRFIDDTKQWHQFKLKYSKAGEWELFRIELNNVKHKHFGGANDGVIHYPIKMIEFLVSNSQDVYEGDVKFSNVKLLE